MMKKIIQQLKSSRRVLLASHANPDGDAIGSLLAMGIALEKLGCDVALYNESAIPAVYRFLPMVDTIHNRLPDSEDFDTAVVWTVAT